jgi:ATP-dependent Clp protease ATP-binding subunit ClpX
MDDIELVFQDDALREIASVTVERKTGARGLRSIIESVLREVMFTSPSDKSIAKITITKDCINGNGKPEIIKDSNRSKKKSKRSEIDIPLE